MLRLPTFTYHRPQTAAEAVLIASQHGKDAMYVAGGTDLYPNMKRRHQTPKTLVALGGLERLRGVRGGPRREPLARDAATASPLQRAAARGPRGLRPFPTRVSPPVVHEPATDLNPQRADGAR